MTEVLDVYTDGSCFPNPGEGGHGHAYYAPQSNKVKSFWFGPFDGATNNQMELQGVLQVLKKFWGHPARIRIYSDSQYVVNGCTVWVFAWAKKGWVTASGSPVKNREIYEEIMNVWLSYPASQRPQFRWLKGHANNGLNEHAHTAAENGRLGVPMENPEEGMEEETYGDPVHEELAQEYVSAHRLFQIIDAEWHRIESGEEVFLSLLRKNVAKKASHKVHYGDGKKKGGKK